VISFENISVDEVTIEMVGRGSSLWFSSRPATVV